MDNRKHILGAVALYDTIKDLKDKSTRNCLYIEWIYKYFPEAFEVLTGTNDLSEVRRSKI